MGLSDPSLDQFIALSASEFGETLTATEARPVATNLVNLYRKVMQPLPKQAADPGQTASAAS